MEQLSSQPHAYITLTLKHNKYILLLCYISSQPHAYIMLTLKHNGDEEGGGGGGGCRGAKAREE